MRKFALSSSVLGVALFALLQASPAQAQATRTWVSGVGDDANPCSRTAPCKTFAGAISKTAALGQINCIDPGGFGAVTITKSITIECTNVEAGVLVSGTNGIIINVPNATDRVELNGLDLEGLGTGLDGVKIIGSGKIFIRNLRINGFTGNGVNSVGTANANVTVVDSFLTNNGGGINIAGAGNVVQTAFVARTVINFNTNFAVQANGSNSSMSVASSFLTNSPTGVSILNSGVVVSFGPSNVLTGGGAFTTPPSPIAFK
jgi:hypothetical protein